MGKNREKQKEETINSENPAFLRDFLLFCGHLPVDTGFYI